ncbi:uncharacterized protein LOC131497533 isoform X1 [Neofelis nebulosa]|uniref:uncharacterized protein LOC131497533 isoform X1 n=1 Tax=Neofelis nebulosa TaxID=61452 RepID=UPI00272C9943|nr:uncharacterized protein LOC131497533 isoform X1 [Neofelis nebulosa]
MPPATSSGLVTPAAARSGSPTLAKETRWPSLPRPLRVRIAWILDLDYPQPGSLTKAAPPRLPRGLLCFRVRAACPLPADALRMPDRPAVPTAPPAGLAEPQPSLYRDLLGCPLLPASFCAFRGPRRLEGHIHPDTGKSHLKRDVFQPGNPHSRSDAPKRPPSHSPGRNSEAQPPLITEKEKEQKDTPKAKVTSASEILQTAVGNSQTHP